MAGEAEPLVAERVTFTKEKATGLITLYARALRSRSGEGILHDPWAERAAGRGAS